MTIFSELYYRILRVQCWSLKFVWEFLSEFHHIFFVARRSVLIQDAVGSSMILGSFFKRVCDVILSIFPCVSYFRLWQRHFISKIALLSCLSTWKLNRTGPYHCFQCFLKILFSDFKFHSQSLQFITQAAASLALFYLCQMCLWVGLFGQLGFFTSKSFLRIICYNWETRFYFFVTLKSWSLFVFDCYLYN